MDVDAFVGVRRVVRNRSERPELFGEIPAVDLPVAGEIIERARDPGVSEFDGGTAFRWIGAVGEFVLDALQCPGAFTYAFGIRFRIAHRSPSCKGHVKVQIVGQR